MSREMDEEAKRQRQSKPEDRKDCGCGFGKACMMNQNHHWAPRDFEQRYMRMYDLKDQAQIRRISHEEVKQIKLTHGLPETASELAGPPPGWGKSVAELGRQSAERRAIMEGLKLKEQTVPPPGETVETTRPWSRIELTPAEIAIQSDRATVMQAELMRIAHDRKEITDEEFDHFRRTGILPAKAYEPPPL